MIINFLSLFYALISHYGELTKNSNKLWKIDSFYLSLKYLFPILTLIITQILLIRFRDEFVDLFLIRIYK